MCRIETKENNLMKRRLLIATSFITLISMLGTLLGFTFSLIPVSVVQNTPVHKSAVQSAALTQTNTVPTPFMHRPYYGSQTILQRTTSFIDHDRPWYDNDGTFVRYDGTKWTNVAIGSCIGGVDCYDGHNGYDLNLRFEPVLSAAAGTVIRAGWYNPYDHQS